ncbi:MAG: glutathione S-transferase family protein [Myxococcota bacterium]
MPVSDDRVTFYYNPNSRAQMVHWALEELGVPYDTQLIRFSADEHKTPEFLALNPMGKLPTIEHRGVVVTEAAAIITYLADAYPDSGLAPAFNDPARGTWLRWLFFTAGCVEPAVMDKAFQRPPIERKGSVGYGSYEDTMDALETAITPGALILGERFSAADVYLGAQVMWGLKFGNIEARPAIVAYNARCSERPAHQRVMAQAEAWRKKL